MTATGAVSSPSLWIHWMTLKGVVFAVLITLNGGLRAFWIIAGLDTGAWGIVYEDSRM